MQPSPEGHQPHSSFRIPAWVVLCVFAAVTVVFLWTEHRTRLLGTGLSALLLVCPLMHVLMHGRHGSHGARRQRQVSHRDDRAHGSEGK